MATGCHARVVHFQGSGSSGSQTITDALGPGQTPKAALFVLSGATSLDTLTSNGRISIGMTDGTTQRSVGYATEDGAVAGSARSAARADVDTVIQMPAGNAGGALDIEASFSSFGNNSVTISWSAGTTLRGFVVLFYGEVLQANVVSLAGSSSIGGTASTTAPGFQPDAIIGVRVNLAFSADNSTSNGMISFGVATRAGSIKHMCSAATVENASGGNTSSGVVLRDDVILTTLSSSGGTISSGARLAVSAFNADGFTVTTSNAAVSIEGAFLSLRLAGDTCWAGVETVTAGSTGSKSITTPGFKGLLAIFTGPRSATVNTVGSGQGQFFVGACDRNLTQGAAGLQAVDNQTSTSATHSAMRSVDCVDVQQNSTTYDWLANQTAFTSSGLTLNVSDAGTGDRILGVADLGVDRPDLNWLPEATGHRRWRRQLARM